VAGAAHTTGAIGAHERVSPPTVDGELQVDALFADVASAEHSLLFHAAVALRAVSQKSRAAMLHEAYPANAAVVDGVSSPPTTPNARNSHSRDAAPCDGMADELAAYGAAYGAANGADADTERCDLQLDSLLKALDTAVVQVLSSLGPAMLILVKNDQSNLRKVREAAAAASCASAESGAKADSVRALLEDELRRGMHKPGVVIPPDGAPASSPLAGGGGGADGRGLMGSGGSAASSPARRRAPDDPMRVGTGGATLYDPSAAISLLWLRRSLKFTVVLMELLLEGKQSLEDSERLGELMLLDGDDPSSPSMADPTADAVRGAYNEVLRPFHSWLLRKTVDIVTTQVPHLDEAIAMLSPGLGDAERELKCFAEIRMYVAEGWPVINTLDAIFAELKLEDLRQV